MRHIIIAFILCVSTANGLFADTTIEDCVKKAMTNYPLVKKYGLITATKEIDLSDINKSWLPKIGLYAQATAQNIVPSFPDALSDVLNKMGQTIDGLGRIQYKTGIEVSQTIWDGGAASAERELAASRSTLKQAALDVELYNIRQKVENLYFAILLTDEQIDRSLITYNLLIDNHKKVKSMLRNGTAMRADADMIEAQALSLNQTVSQARFASENYRHLLELYIGESLDGQNLAIPDADIPLELESSRPELKLFERRIDADYAAQRLADIATRPKIGIFAQAFYGYPGFDYFRSIIDRKLSFNILAGVKISWNIDAFYSRKNNSRKTRINISDINADRELFNFNTSLQSASQIETIRGLQAIMKDDNRIIALRTDVRKAAEAQLLNGIIDTTALLAKIADENTAMLNARFHEIQLLQEIYKLKYILDR